MRRETLAAPGAASFRAHTTRRALRCRLL